ncbi:hypothetical protein ACFV1C_06985 [Streptomyces sp. NPDC059605]|uniref:hypothetical protein n=1 Tax=unclassified Streptomyces TaxID=2593676 RepID=UPI0036C09310
MTEADGPRRQYAAEQAYYWALIASDLRDDARTEARRVRNSDDPESATPWQQWAVAVPPSTTRQQAAELALMWVKVASVQEDEER